MNFLLIGSKPINIVYPLPLASFLALVLSKSNIESFLISYLFCFFFFTAVNLWNHVNDAEDDAKGGKEEAIFLIERKKEASFFSVILYLLSAIFILFTKDAIAIPAFLICVAITWIYSDKMLFGRCLRRLKEDYRTELLTYAIVTPSFFILLWSFFLQISIKGICFALILSLIYLSAILLKDLKDLTSDTLAGYRTLAVIFSPEKLFKSSAFLFTMTIFLIAFLSFVELFPKTTAITVLMLLPVLYSTISIKKQNWELSLKTLRELRVYTLSFPLTLIVFAILSFEF
ncbi:MAG: UbiA family prenyltransferase [Archaeoglobales archaeon]|nr:UbiA family prenyltransferase [Archaeoglobales archaeon]